MEEKIALKKEIEYWKGQVKVAREEIDNAVKETAGKILGLVFWKICKRNNYDLDYKTDANEVREVLDEIKKEYGVDIDNTSNNDT